MYDLDEIDDDDDDDEIVLVSSTRERWEKLHGIEKNGEENNIEGNRGSTHHDDGDEDDILVVAVRPTPTRLTENSSASLWEYMCQRTPVGLSEFGGCDARTESLLQSSFQIYVLFAGIALSIWMITRSPKKRKLEPRTKGQVDSSDMSILSSTPRSPTVESEENVADNNDLTCEETNAREISGFNLGSSVSENSESAWNNRQSSSNISQLARASSSSIETRNQNETLEMARQFAQDVRLVQEVLVENSLDPLMAPQLAISLQSSQRIVDSQRELCYQKAMLDTHQRDLDRKLSEEQHRESLRGARYDPNWREKLERIRDECYYWNSSNGGVARLWWEVLLIQQFAIGIHRFRDSSNAGRGEHNHDLSTAASFLKGTVASVLAEVCDCESSCTTFGEFTPVAMKGIESTTTTTASWIVPAVASPIFSLNIDISDAVSSFFPLPFEHWTCYGYCIVLASMLLCFTIICHQGLRMLSLPPFLHHVVNLASMTLFYGPERTLNLVCSTLLRMVLVVPARDHRCGGRAEPEHEWQQPPSGSSTLIGCSFLLVSLWVLLPIWSWNKTSTLYQEAKLRVVRADPVDFEAAVRNGTFHLKQWQREQTTMRYVLLSMYLALVLQE